jgi:hypothetical protein
MDYVNNIDNELEKAMAIKVDVFNSTSLCLKSTLNALKDAERNNFRLRKMKNTKVWAPGMKEVKVVPRKFSDIAKTFRKLLNLD